MKRKCISSITLALVMLGFLAVNSAHAINWTVTQLTDNSYNDYRLQIYGSNVVWAGFDGGDWDIFLATPEPATLGLLILGGAALLRRKRAG